MKRFMGFLVFCVLLASMLFASIQLGDNLNDYIDFKIEKTKEKKK